MYCRLVRLFMSDFSLALPERPFKSKTITVKRVILIIIFLCACFDGFTQETDPASTDSLSEKSNELSRKMYYYNLQKPSATLFVHFDKNIYTNNESVWFSAYLLKGMANEAYSALSVALLNNADSTVAMQEKFLMANGLAYGNMLLPDSLPAGNYSLIAFSNQLVNGVPEDVFVQPVTIKSVTEPRFLASLKLGDSLKSLQDTIRVALKVNTKDFRVVRDAEVLYTVGKGKQLLLSGKAKTDFWGEYKIAIPAAKLNASNSLLQVQVKADKETRKLRMQLPVFDTLPKMNFYPEGGYMVEQLPVVVAFEVTAASGEPLPAIALLYENDLVKDTVHTDAFGIGKFRVKALPGKKYTAKLLGKTGTGKAYELPAALKEGAAIHVKNAIANDTVYIKLLTQHAGMYHMLLHNYKQVYQEFDLQAMQAVSKELSFSLAEVPRGVVAVTLLDSTGKPCAERMIFAHYDQRPVVTVATDSSVYATRKKVRLSLRIAGDTTITKNALVSVACVQENRLDLRKAQDIESYFYFKHDMAATQYPYRPLSNDPLILGYLQNILLVKGWRKYTWQDMQAAKPEDTVQRRSSLDVTGLVRKYEKPVKKPTPLVIIHTSSYKFFSTDSSGRFTLANDSMVMEQGKKAMLTVAGNNVRKSDYGIEINDPFAIWNKKLAVENTANWEEPKVPVQDTRFTLIPNNEKVRTLETVVVSTKNDNSVYGATRNACGDYVCMYNILNCPNHTVGGTMPIEGHTYSFPGGGKIVYAGCNEVAHDNVVSVKGIYMHKEFYGSDYAVANPTEPEYISTIFWKHEAMLTPQAETTFSFYTSDITGRFKIVVQGITSNGVIYGEQTFNVIKGN